MMGEEMHAYLANFCTLQDTVGYILRLLLQWRGHHCKPKICRNALYIYSLWGPSEALLRLRSFLFSND